MNPTDGLKPGRIVYFVFNQQSIDEVMRQRETVVSGRQLTGNPMAVGDVYPAMVVRVWHGTSVNLKVMLDGTDTFWATSVEFSDEKAPRSWHWMFEGQNTRYQPDRVEKATA